MQPGPIIIKECPECSKYISERTLRSGNTFGARFWTDGKMVAPMLPDHPCFVKCPHCETLLWIDELEEIDQIPIGIFQNLFEHSDNLEAYPELADRLKFRDAKFPDEVPLDDYLDELDKGPTDLEKERYLRFRALWSMNDRRRDSKVEYNLTDREKTNLVELSKMLDESNDNDRILKAELFRELGMFDEAEKLLSKKFDRNLTQVFDTIKDLVQKHSTAVVEIQFEE